MVIIEVSKTYTIHTQYKTYANLKVYIPEHEQGGQIFLVGTCSLDWSIHRVSINYALITSIEQELPNQEEKSTGTELPGK